MTAPTPYIGTDFETYGVLRLALRPDAMGDAYEAGAAPRRLSNRIVWIHVEDGRPIVSRSHVFTAEGSSVWHHGMTRAEAKAIMAWAFDRMGVAR